MTISTTPTYSPNQSSPTCEYPRQVHKTPSSINIPLKISLDKTVRTTELLTLKKQHQRLIIEGQKTHLHSYHVKVLTGDPSDRYFVILKDIPHASQRSDGKGSEGRQIDLYIQDALNDPETIRQNTNLIIPPHRCLENQDDPLTFEVTIYVKTDDQF